MLRPVASALRTLSLLPGAGLVCKLPGSQATLVGQAGSQGLGPCMEEEALSIYLEDTQQLFQDLASILRVLM